MMDILNLFGPAEIFVVVIGIILLLMLFTWKLLTFVPVRLWIETWAAGVPILLGTLIGMRLRKVRPEAVVRPMIKATKAGLSLSLDVMEAHHLAGGKVDAVVGALINADKVGMSLSYAEVAASDLVGRDVGDEVKQRIAVASGEAHEMACPHCGKRFEIDRHILMGFVEALRDYPPFQHLMRPKG